MSGEFATETIEFCGAHAVSRRVCGCTYKLPSHVDVQEGDTLAAVVDDLSDWFSSYVYTRNPHAYIVLALWVVHTHAIHEVASTPRIQITSPQPECGKTTLVEHLEHLTLNALMASHATPALVARIVHAQTTTLLLDETDNLLNPKKEGVGDLTAVLNAGYRRGMTRPVLTPKPKSEGGGWHVEQMNTYSAVALSGIGHHLPEALTSRCIQIELDRAMPGQVSYTDWDECELPAWALRDRVSAVVEASLEDFSKPKPTVSGLHGRTREVWLPLLQVANIAGPEVLDRALAAYKSLVAASKAAAELRPKRQEEQILLDLRKVHDEEGKPSGDAFVATEDLLTGLRKQSPETWGEEARFGRLKSKRLAMLLGGYGVHPTRNSTGRQRGYYWGELSFALDRYLPGNVSDASKVSDVSKLEGSPGATADACDSFDASDGLTGISRSTPSETPRPKQNRLVPLTARDTA